MSALNMLDSKSRLTVQTHKAKVKFALKEMGMNHGSLYTKNLVTVVCKT
jgi:hypothetical protein